MVHEGFDVSALGVIDRRLRERLPALEREQVKDKVAEARRIRRDTMAALQTKTTASQLPDRH